jgi:hypothetical protein
VCPPPKERAFKLATLEAKEGPKLMRLATPSRNFSSSWSQFSQYATGYLTYQTRPADCTSGDKIKLFRKYIC